MAENSADTLREDLGVGGIFGDTFSVFFSRFLQIAFLAIIPAIAAALIGNVLISPLLISPDTRNLAVVLSWVASMIASAISVAFVIRYTFDARSGRRMRTGSYISSTMTVLVPLIVCSLVSSAVAALVVLLFAAPGIVTRNSILLIVLVIPGIALAIYIAAIWVSVTPSIVIEKAGFGSFARSAELTRNYRWPCFAANLLVVLLGLGYTQATNSATNALFVSQIGIQSSLFFYTSIRVIAGAILVGFTGVFSATLYARLREIKEGTSVENLAEVFA
jgi:hypothetical protein